MRSPSSPASPEARRARPRALPRVPLGPEWRSDLLERARREGLRAGGAEVRLAAELGFCYGVERALELATAASARFPERRVLLSGALVHNDDVSARLRRMGVLTLAGEDPARLAEVRPDDVVLIPAFGCPLEELERLVELGCELVDTTCGSVLAVWKQARRLVREGFTVLIHGRHDHEETRATCSRVLREGGRYAVLRGLEQAAWVADAIGGRLPGVELVARLGPALSPGFAPERDLQRVGCAQQTTMLASESLTLAAVVRQAVLDRHGPDELERRFRAHETVCSATQDRQDALRALLADPPDLVLAVGGRASSNTSHLAELAASVCPGYHVADERDLISRAELRHQLPETRQVVTTRDWLPGAPRRIGVTAGASTPAPVTAAVLARLVALLDG